MTPAPTDLKPAPVTGSMADHEKLCDTYIAFSCWVPGSDREGSLRVLMVYLDKLSAAAKLCGWNGSDDLVNWSTTRTEAYDRNIASGFTYQHKPVEGF